MPDGTFVAALASEMRTPEVVEGRVFTPNDWKEAEEKQYSPNHLALNTLVGLSDYIGSNVDAHDLLKTTIHVVDHATVRLIGKLEPEEGRFRRQCFAVSSASSLAFKFGEYLDAETFVVGLQTQFLPSVDRDGLLATVASIKESAVRETVDDGVAQEVVTSAGVVMKDRARLPNPISLMPYRTFREVAQPMSLFVLRAKGSEGGEKPKLALFEADGGQWKNEAITSIAAWFAQRHPSQAILA